ncbi:MAG TPA: MBL fold metallo-hydrolase [Thermoanaerobaculia bacterium]|nr:MBL fold metallo-hydrolase [Thermoanaerobaculia bacterium]
MFRLSIPLILVATLAVAADNPKTLTERSQARARAILDRSVEAIGGAEALQQIETVTMQLEGETWPRLQMTTPEPPFESGTFHESLTFDLKNNRILLEQRNRGNGFEGHNTIVLGSGEGANYDLRGRTVTPIPAAQATQQQFVQYHRRLPHLLLRQALERSNSLRHLGEENFDGRKHEVITFVMADTQQVALYVDAASGLVSKYELIFTDALTGEDAAEIIFGDYTTVGKLKVPRSWTWRVAGDLQAKYRIRAEFNKAVTDQTFQIADAASFRKVSAPPQNLEARVEKLGDGVWVIHNVAGQNQNTLAVEFKDYVLVVEAPGTSGGADRVIARIKETIPGKPIRYIAMTHHHGDHIGGMRGFIAEGATVVTTRNNRGVIETMAAAALNDRLGKSPRKPEFALLENGKRVLTDGQQTVELIDIGPNPHAREMVIAWLPRQRILFQGDLFFVPNNDAPFGPPQATTLSFAKKLKELGLGVDRIAGVHGRTATIEEFRLASEGAGSAGSSQ